MSIPLGSAPQILVDVIEERDAKQIRRSIRWSFSDKPGQNNAPIEYLFEGDLLPLPLACLDFAVTALLFYAMRTGYDLHVNGRVSKKLLANLEEFQRIWNKWWPDRYKVIRITATKEEDVNVLDDGSAILAYSGGVDANFSLASHCTGSAGRRSRKIRAATLIHGFDIPLDQRELFDRSACLARRVLSSFSVPLTTITTNWKQSVCSDWEMEFGAAIASCLFQFAGHASVCLLGSDEDYGSREFIWGSNPISNPYLWGEIALVTDGAGYSRTEKAALIARHLELKNNLRVCWEGRNRGGPEGTNCGHCEKCIRTKLNFLANGTTPGQSLMPLPSLLEILFINARNSVQIALLKDILSVATQNGINARWVTALKIGICRAFARNFIRDNLYRPIKRVLRSFNR